jgi:hypothetical protein
VKSNQESDARFSALGRPNRLARAILVRLELIRRLSVVISVAATLALLPSFSNATDSNPSKAGSQKTSIGPFEGYGAEVTGGNGKRVVVVKNLKDTGAGSLRAALGDNRTIKFEVSGTIKLATYLPMFHQNLTLDGFSAPSPGITLTGGSSDGCMEVYGPGYTDGITIPGAHAANIVIQGIRFRNCNGTDIKIGYSSHHIVVDHVSATGGSDGTIDVTTGAHDVTLSWNIISNNVNASGATLIKYSVRHVSLHHNIYYNNYGNSRVPWCEGGDDRTSGSVRDLGVVCDVRYNVISKWLIGTLFDSDATTKSYGNVVGNYYDGQDQDHARTNISISRNPLVSAYVAGNASVLNPAGCPYGMTVIPACIRNTNDPGNHAEYGVPPVSGPAPSDNQGRLDMWKAVLTQAGVATHFPDDQDDARIRSGITPPTATILARPWNAPITSANGSSK